MQQNVTHQVRSANLSAPLTRRQALTTIGAAAAGALLTGSLASAASTRPNVLLFIKICDVPPNTLAKNLAQLQKVAVSTAASNGFNLTVTTDGSVFSSSSLSSYNVVLFYSTGNLTKQAGEGGKPISQTGANALLKMIAAGKAVVIEHAGLVTTPPSDPTASALAELQLLFSTLPQVLSGKKGTLNVAVTGATCAGGVVGTTPLPLQMIALVTGTGANRRPVFSLMFASTSPLLKNTMKAANP
jgi:hypothetical protein